MSIFFLLPPSIAEGIEVVFRCGHRSEPSRWRCPVRCADHRPPRTPKTGRRDSSLSTDPECATTSPNSQFESPLDQDQPQLARWSEASSGAEWQEFGELLQETSSSCFARRPVCNLASHALRRARLLPRFDGLPESFYTAHAVTRSKSRATVPVGKTAALRPRSRLFVAAGQVGEVQRADV